MKRKCLTLARVHALLYEKNGGFDFGDGGWVG